MTYWDFESFAHKSIRQIDKRMVSRSKNGFVRIWHEMGQAHSCMLHGLLQVTDPTTNRSYLDLQLQAGLISDNPHVYLKIRCKL